MRRRDGIRWTVGAVLLTLAVLLSACGRADPGPAAPGAALTDAVEKTMDDSFAFSVRVEVDAAATATVAATEPLLATLLPDLELRGQRTSSGFAVELLASGQRLVEWRQPQPDRLYARVQAGTIAETFDVPLDRTRLLDELTAGPPRVAELYETALDGAWVGVTGPPEQLPLPDERGMPDYDSDGIRTAEREHLGGSVAEALRRFTTATEAPGGGGRRLEVALQTRALAEALAELQRVEYAEMFGEERADIAAGMADFSAVPTAMSGLLVEIRDRRVQRVTVDLFEMARQISTGDEAPDGSLRLVVEVSEHGTASVAVPDDPTVFAASELGMGHPQRLLPLGPGLDIPWWRTLLFIASPFGTGSAEVQIEGHAESAVPVAPAETPSAVPLTPDTPAEAPASPDGG